MATLTLRGWLMDSSITLNAKMGKARRVVENGVTYLVAPATSIVPGVLHGSKGALYYPPDEIRSVVKAWDGMPLTLGHPFTPQGEPVSAAHPGILERQGLGHIRNSRINKDHKLQHDCWFDEERLRRLHPQLHHAVSHGLPVEISTGLFTQNIKAPPYARDSRGRQYDYIATKYKPDHLAILVDERGACSVADGCGLHINRAEELADNKKAPSLVKQIREQLEEDYPDGVTEWVKDAKWEGPTTVPIDQIDYSNRKRWKAWSEPEKVEKFMDKLRRGKMKPVILVRTPGAKELIVIDGHHRSLAHRKLGTPVLAYVGTVSKKTGPWDEMHSQQRKSDDPGSTKATANRRSTDAARKLLMTLQGIGHVLSKKVMPGYGQVYFKADAPDAPESGQVWYVGGDGDPPNHYERVRRKFGSVKGVNRVIYEAETAPKKPGWVKVYPAAPTENQCVGCGATKVNGVCPCSGITNTESGAKIFGDGIEPYEVAGKNAHAAAMGHSFSGSAVRCPKCGTLMKRQGDKYVCPKCGHVTKVPANNTDEMNDMETLTTALNSVVNEIVATYNRDWPQSKRDKLPKEDFAGPDQSFPIATQEDVYAAVHSLGRTKHDRDKVKARIKSIAKRKGFKLPDAWEGESTNNEDVTSKLMTAVTEATVSPTTPTTHNFDHTSLLSPEGVPETATAAEYFITILHAATGAHLLHFQTRSFAAHKAMDELYKELPKLADDLVEQYQGAFGALVSDYPGGFTPPTADPLDYTRAVRQFVMDNRAAVGSETGLQATVDDIIRFLDGVIYKLQFLN